MWLITTLIFAIIVTLLCFILKNKYRLGFLSLMLWGAVIMILTDHILGYEGGKFIELETEGMVNSGTLLGIIMLVPVFLVWLGSMFFSKLKQR